MASWIETLVTNWGVLGIAFLMFVENVFPPIPSELIMPLAGYAAARGDANIFAVILAGGVGSLAGAFFWYWIGRLVDHDWMKRMADRHGRWLTMDRADIERTDDWFDRRGHIAVMVGRVVPTIRTLISIPAGLSEMPVGRFLFFSAIGTAVWTTGLALFGYGAGSAYDGLEAWIDPLSYAVVGLVVVVYLWRFVTFNRRART